MNHKGTKTQRVPIPDSTNALSRVVVDCSFRVHSTLGPGLLESVYETCLTHEIAKRGIAVRRQVSVPIVYDGLRIDAALRIDLLVEEQLVVEIKAAEALLAVHEAQVLTYLKLTGHRLGLLINFNVATLRTGIRRLVI